MPATAARASCSLSPSEGTSATKKARPPPLSEILRQISAVQAVNRSIVATTITHLRANEAARKISLYTSTRVQVYEECVAWLPSEILKQSIASSSESMKNAKRVANAVLQGLQYLIDSRSGRETSKGSATSNIYPVWILLDCFRIAMAILISSDCAMEQMIPVGLSAVRKLHALSHDSEALTECLAAFHALKPYQCRGTVREPPSAINRLRIAIDTDFDASMASESVVSNVVEIQSLAMQSAMSLIRIQDLPAVADLFRVPSAFIIWQQQARKLQRHSLADRAAYVIERAVFTSAAMESCKDPAKLQVQLDTLLQLGYASHLDVDAFWDRVLRVITQYVSQNPHKETELVQRQLEKLFRCLPERTYGPRYERLCRWLREHTKMEVLPTKQPPGSETRACTRPILANTANHLVVSTKLGTHSNPSENPDESRERQLDRDSIRVSGSEHTFSDPLVASSDMISVRADELKEMRLNPSPLNARLSLKESLLAWQKQRDAKGLEACISSMQSYLRSDSHQDASLDAELGASIAHVLHEIVDSAQSTSGFTTSVLLYTFVLVVQHGSYTACYSDAIHALRIACVQDFEIGKPASYDKCADYLQLASEFAKGNGSRLNYVSEVASHFGCRLYTAEQYGQAVRFLVLARDTCYDANTHKVSSSSLDSVTEQTVRKSQVLAGAYQHMGRYEDAYEAYWHAVHQNAATVKLAEETANTKPLPEAIDDQEPLKLLGSLLSGALHLAVYCLYLPIQASEPNSFLRSLRSLKLTNAALGAWIEYFALVLEPMLLRDETLSALNVLYSAALDLYPSTKYPLRRARILLKQAQHDLVLDQDKNTEITQCLQNAELLDSGLVCTRDDLSCISAMQYALACVNAPQHGADTQREMICAVNDAFTLLRRTDLQLLNQGWLRKSHATNRHMLRKAPLQASLRAETPHKSIKKRSVDDPSTTKAVNQPPLSSAKSLCVTPPRPDTSSRQEKHKLFASSPPLPNLNSTLLSLLSTLCDALLFCGREDQAVQGLLLLLSHTEHSIPDLHSSACARLAQIWLSMNCAQSVCRFLKDKPKNAPLLLLLAQAQAQFVASGCGADSQEALASDPSALSQACATYKEAKALSEDTLPSSSKTSWQKILAKCSEYELRAIEAQTVAKIALQHQVYADAIHATLQALRIYLRMAILLTKSTHESETTPFRDSTKSNLSKARPTYAMLEWRAWHWRTSHSLATLYRQLSEMYAQRGAVRDAIAFAHECMEFCDQSAPTLPRAHAMLWRADLQYALGEKADAEKSWQSANDLSGSSPTIIGIYRRLLLAEWSDNSSLAENLLEELQTQNDLMHVEDAWPASRARLTKLLGKHSVRDNQRFEHTTSQWTAAGKSAGRIQSTKATSSRQASTAQRLEANAEPTLRKSARQQQQSKKQATPSQAKLSQRKPCQDVAKNHGSSECQQDASNSDLVILQHAELLLSEATHTLYSDATWSVLPEAAWVVPNVANPNVRRSKVSLVKQILGLLDQAHTLLSDLLHRSAATGDVRIIRRALRAMFRTCHWHAIVQPAHQKEWVHRMAGLLDASMSVSVRRAYIDAAVYRRQKPSNESMQVPPDPIADGIIAQSIQADGDAWREHHLSTLPDSIAICITYSEDHRELHMVRITETSKALYVLPIDRQSRREGEDESLTMDATLEELRRILATSNASVQSAKNVHALEDRKVWWTQRRKLDDELKQLLEAVESTWIGAFQGLFSEPEISVDSLKKSIESAFERACIGQQAHKLQFVLNQGAACCLASLPADCPMEILEDWAHFAMDACQLAGMVIAQDEVDMDELCMDIRNALEEYHAQLRKLSSKDHIPSQPDLFLVLDRELGEIPWESMPFLRSRSITRVPSLHFLAAAGSSRRSLQIDRTAYLLNPSGDLIRSEARFSPMLRSNAHWRGCIGHAPVVDEVAQALADNDTFLYFGHAGGELYIQPTQLRSLSKCATVMLWGCSSGRLKEYGEYDTDGTPYRYMAAQCPALLANLWDTTDKELDGVCEAVLSLVGLHPSSTNHLTLAQAVAQARTYCKLPYLTGAACVVYGVPVDWGHAENASFSTA
ncbi:separase [Malassezia yamatoensis]|uniref:separase n=1 Tax=Malassezia yamatoensis TaxID=253288 RepID=A0AAJ5YQQ3_9BASI|nr:separase [Malassezia yamatoensis]